MSRYYYILIFILMGCSSNFPIVVQPDLDKPIPFIDNGKNITTHIIKDFIKSDDNLDDVPDSLFTLTLTEPITFYDLFQMLIVQGINVMTEIDTQKMISIPSFAGDLKTFLKMLQNSYGLFFIYDSNTLQIREKSTVYVKVLMPESKNGITKLIETFGIEKSFYDELSSRIIFESDYYTFQKIQNYFYNNPYLSFVNFDIMVLESQESNNQESGIDWHKLVAQIQDFTSLPLDIKIEGDGSGAFTLGIQNDHISINEVFSALLEKQNYKVLQSARISTLNGNIAILDVSEKIPYISSIDIGSLNDNSNSVVQGYEFSTATSGIVLKLRPTISGNLISIDFDSKIQSLIDFLEVGTSAQTVQQPVLSIRNIKNQVIVRPGEITLIGGLRYQKGGFTYKTLDFIESGLKQNEERSFSITILLKAELIRYVFQKGGI